MVWVKICGVTSVQDALGCMEAGADAIGVNFYKRSPRFCQPAVARDIVEAVGSQIEVVGVFVDADYQQIGARRSAVGFTCAQLHGGEPSELLEKLLPNAYKALRVRDFRAVAEARRYGGERLLLDAYVPGLAGGTGSRFDWAVAKQIAAERRVIIAGGINSDNVAEVIAAVSPFGVDAASGVELSPGRKDLAAVAAFVRAAKQVEGETQ